MIELVAVVIDIVFPSKVVMNHWKKSTLVISEEFPDALEKPLMGHKVIGELAALRALKRRIHRAHVPVADELDLDITTETIRIEARLTSYLAGFWLPQLTALFHSAKVFDATVNMNISHATFSEERALDKEYHHLANYNRVVFDSLDIQEKLKSDFVIFDIGSWGSLRFEGKSVVFFESIGLSHTANLQPGTVTWDAIQDNEVRKPVFVTNNPFVMHCLPGEELRIQGWFERRAPRGLGIVNVTSGWPGIVVAGPGACRFLDSISSSLFTIQQGLLLNPAPLTLTGSAVVACIPNMITDTIYIAAKETSIDHLVRQQDLPIVDGVELLKLRNL